MPTTSMPVPVVFSPANSSHSNNYSVLVKIEKCKAIPSYNAKIECLSKVDDYIHQEQKGDVEFGLALMLIMIIVAALVITYFKLRDKKYFW